MKLNVSKFDLFFKILALIFIFLGIVQRIHSLVIIALILFIMCLVEDVFYKKN